MTDVFNTMQIYLGSQYVNDFNRFGRVYQVRAQADAPFRANPEDILQLKPVIVPDKWCHYLHW